MLGIIIGSILISIGFIVNESLSPTSAISGTFLFSILFVISAMIIDKQLRRRGG